MVRAPSSGAWTAPCGGRYAADLTGGGGRARPALRGVVHGVHAAYPVMLRQGSGHIVNVASVAGLLPNPGFAPYAATKWAVVGLSLSLRGEAASRGVRVSVVCPGGVDTPMLDKGMPSDLPRVPTVEAADVRAVITALSGGRLYSADALAADVLCGVDRSAG
ncbi:SDR family oxidoreductase [Blastococcus sp. SYSU DS0669]